MSNQKTGAMTLLVGAGAECIEPYKLPIGDGFTWDTCFTKNEDLYKALEEYYTPKLSRSGSGFPHKYQDAFLYSPSSPEFKRLISELVPEDEGQDLTDEERDTLRTVFGNDFPTDDSTLSHIRKATLERECYERAFAAIIEKRVSKGDLFAKRDTPLKEAYFGTIETHFSSLLKPGRRNVSFWKLVNYYWSAFFSVSEKLIKQACPETRHLIGAEYYSHVLSDLPNVVEKISTPGLFSDDKCAETYYGKLTGLFDNVITTNYTSLSDKLEVKGGPIHISGALWQFEAPRSLSIRDIRKDTGGEDEIIFPYLLTQAPIKPIVCWEQAAELSRMIEALKETSHLCILGYSFCPNDAHVASIVASWLQLDEHRQLHYFDYDGKYTVENLCELLRIDEKDCARRIHIAPCKDLRQQIDAIKRASKRI